MERRDWGVDGVEDEEGVSVDDVRDVGVDGASSSCNGAIGACDGPDGTVVCISSSSYSCSSNTNVPCDEICTMDRVGPTIVNVGS